MADDHHLSFEEVDVRIIDVARRVIAGELGVIEGSQIIARLSRKSRRPDDEIFLVFRGVDSEVDGLPNREERGRWSASRLASKDVERSEYEEEVRRAVVNGCSEVLKCLGSVN